MKIGITSWRISSGAILAKVDTSNKAFCCTCGSDEVLTQSIRTSTRTSFLSSRTFCEGISLANFSGERNQTYGCPFKDSS